MNIKTLLRERRIELKFVSNINKEIKKEISQGEIITNNSSFTENLLLKNNIKNFYPVKDSSLETALRVENRIKKKKVIGLGGGKAIDIAKKIASDLNISLVSFPTAPSHDGLISKNCSLYNNSGKRISIPAVYPLKIFIPLNLWRASGSLKKAGFCDIVSNIIALEDISLAEKKNGEKFNDFYKKSSERAIKYATLKNDRKLALALLYSGLAMEETSRYCSGSEHDIERLIENKMKNHFLHGQLACAGALISAKVYSLYSTSFPKLKFPPKTLFKRIVLKIKRNKVFDFAISPLKNRSFQPLWLKEVSDIRPERFNLWNVINSRKLDWKKIISDIITQN